MITWLQLTPGARVARNDRTLRVGLVAGGVVACFLIGFLF